MRLPEARRYAPMGAIALLGISATIAVFFVFQGLEDERVSTEIARRATSYSVAVQLGLDRSVGVVDSVGGFFEGSVEVTREEFSAFTRSALERQPAIQALEWIPRVTQDERAGYEEAARREGFTGFRITERSEGGRLVEAARRSDYYPVYFVRPLDGNEQALGYDLASNPTRRQALEEARDKGVMAATGRIRLVQEKANESGFLVFRPVYLQGAALDSQEERRANLAGFALGVFRVGDFVRASIHGFPGNDFDIYVEDGGTQPGGRFLYSHSVGLDSGSFQGETAFPREPPTKFDVHLTVSLPGRQWLLRLSPSPGLVQAVNTSRPLVYAALTFLFWVGMVVHMNFRRRRSLRIEELASELSQSNEALQRDIGERERAQSEIQALRDHLELQVRRMPMALITWDRQFAVKSWNPAAEKMFGFTEAEALGKHPYELIVPAGAQSLVDSIWRRLLEGDETAHSTNENITKDGRAIVCEWSNTPLTIAEGKVVGVLSMVEDITDKEKAEEGLRRSESKYRNLVGTLREGVYQADLSAACITINPAGARILGFDSPDHVIGKHQMTEFFADIHDRELIAGAIAKAGSWGGEVQARTVDGHLIWLYAGCSLMIDEDGKIIGSEGVFSDITPRKRAEEEKERVQGLLFQSQKLEAIGKLAGGIAHDFNNLLTVINGCSELLLRKVGATDPARADIEAISEAGEKAASLTRQILAFSRKQTATPVVFDLGELVAGAQKLLRRLVRENIGLSVLAGPGGPWVKADRAQLEQVVMNLSVNAVDAMPDGGELTVETRNVRLMEESADAAPGRRPGDFALLTVRDTGTGMTADVLQHIFEPFFTTKSETKGTGLGLSVVYGIVERHQGRIEVRSRPGKGTVFDIYLPAVPAGTESPNSGQSRPECSHGDGKRVMLVEDDVGVRAYVANVLRGRGYKVFEAGTSTQALEVFEREKEDMGLLFSDVVLPDGSGLALARQLTSLKAGLPVIMASGYNEQGGELNASERNGFRFLQKPFGLAELLAAVAELARWPQTAGRNSADAASRSPEQTAP